ncbi:MAG: DUF1707 domain-containing protein, partial [Pseudonocardia sp.]|nr:DUF1707 domain-containing protein [Pseudonocardia sp.]
MTAGDGNNDPGPVRIGTAERTSAMKALDEHLAAGRLGVEEYADRSAAAADATVASELTALFTDLPAPHPVVGDAAPVELAKPAAEPAVRADGTVATRSERFLDTWGGRIVAVTPIIALVLFFVTQQWWFFLLIPAVGALVYGGHYGRDEERDRRRD